LFIVSQISAYTLDIYDVVDIIFVSDTETDYM